MPFFITTIIREGVPMSAVHLNTLSFMQQLHRQVLVAVACRTAEAFNESGYHTMTLVLLSLYCKGMTATSEYLPSEHLQLMLQTELFITPCKAC